jgi:hypothetical protein
MALPIANDPRVKAAKVVTLILDRIPKLACCGFRGHREKVFDEAGGGPWEGECFRESSRLRRFG